MAIQPVSNETFYREVDEELRRDQVAGFWKRYGVLVILGVVLLLAAIGGAIWWQNRQAEKAGEQGETLTAAFDDIQAGKAGQVGPRLDQLSNEGSPGYRAAALLTKAATAVQSGNDAAAVAAYRQVAEDDDIAEPYRNLALIRQTAVEFDTLQPAQVVQRLQPLATPGSPWFGSAGEMVAIAYLKQQQPAKAAPIFAAMAKDKTLPRSMRSRALQMAGALGLDVVDEAAAASESGGETKEAKE